MYSIVFIIISIIALIVRPYAYSILLLDLFKRVSDLSFLWDAIRINYKKIGITLLLSLIFIYMFSIFAFVFLQKFYIHDDADDREFYATELTYCGTILE